MKERAEFKQIFGFDAPVCNSSLAIGRFALNIVKLDSMIPGYNGKECTFEGKPGYSMNMAIQEKYGKEAVKIIDKLI